MSDWLWSVAYLPWVQGSFQPRVVTPVGRTLHANPMACGRDMKLPPTVPVDIPGGGSAASAKSGRLQRPSELQNVPTERALRAPSCADTRHTAPLCPARWLTSHFILLIYGTASAHEGEPLSAAVVPSDCQLSSILALRPDAGPGSTGTARAELLATRQRRASDAPLPWKLRSTRGQARTLKMRPARRSIDAAAIAEIGWRRPPSKRRFRPAPRRTA